MPLPSESDLEINSKAIEMLRSFPTVIFIPQYDKWFRSYDFLNWTGLLELCSEHN
jgi:hypothetical protein